MTIELIDCFAGCGGVKTGEEEYALPDVLAENMKRIDIAKALVRIEPTDLDIGISLSVQQLHKMCSEHESFIPCPVVAPAVCDDIPSEKEQIENAIEKGAASVCIRPTQFSWRLEEWCSGLLFEELEKRRMPVILKKTEIDYPHIVSLAERYKNLPFIMIEVGYRDQRTIIPLLKKFPNIYVSLGWAYSPYRGIEQITEKVGAKQILFGTGWPKTEPMMAVTYLMYSKISDKEKELIGSGNIKRLIGGIEK